MTAIGDDVSTRGQARRMRAITSAMALGAAREPGAEAERRRRDGLRRRLRRPGGATGCGAAGLAAALAGALPGGAAARVAGGVGVLDGAAADLEVIGVGGATMTGHGRVKCKARSGARKNLTS
jgi:hypothetical protein